MTAAPDEMSLAWRNRRVLAARLGWPDGELEICEQLEREFPRWTFSWRPANTCRGFECPIGYHAQRISGPEVWTRSGWQSLRIFAETVEQLRERLAELDG